MVRRPHCNSSLCLAQLLPSCLARGADLAVPAAALTILVSLQTGFNHHVRYMLPVLPFIFISASRVALAFRRADIWLALAAYAGIGWSVTSSVSVFPHSLSYFNELAGGPSGGHVHLGNSNADWGQDLLYLKQWIDLHPAAKPLMLAYDLPLIDPSLAGIEYEPVPVAPNSLRLHDGSRETVGPVPGWCAVSVNKLHSREHDFDYFLQLKPTAMVGYTIYVYHISLDDANQLRRKLGMPELSGPPKAKR